MLPSPEKPSPSTNNDKTRKNLFLVCGLGSLGQHCIALLKEYDAAVIAIDDEEPRNWEFPELPNLLEKLIIGDCRQPSILEQANIRQCRSVLLVTSNERRNIEAAFAARRLNPKIRLIVRSDKQNFNELLAENLGNFIAFEPTQLSASAFARTVLGAETIGYFNLEAQLLRVVKHEVKQGDPWSGRTPVHINSDTSRILSHTSFSSNLPRQFYEWEPEATVQAGDTVVYIEVTQRLKTDFQKSAKVSYRARRRWQEIFLAMRWKNLKPKIANIWKSVYQSQNQVRRVAIIYAIAVLMLWLTGIVLYSLYYPQISVEEAIYATAVLLLGGYGDLFGSVKYASQPAPAEHMPWWLRLFSFGLTLSGEAFVGVLYAMLTDTLISSKFQFFRNRPPVPKQDHVVLIGLNLVGQRVAELLQELQLPLVGVTRHALNPDILPQLPVVVGNIADALPKANLSRAKSIIVATDDHMENVEIALMARAINSRGSLVIRTYDRLFSENVARLFPYAQVLCSAALSAEVFACAAFGENVLSLFHFYNQMVMVTEYNIEAGDTLNGFLLAEIAYGYGVVPILHQTPHQVPTLMPSENIKLQVGDRLIVLATSIGLQRIEWGDLLPRRWQVQIEKVLNKNAIADGVNKIALIAGCSFSTAKQLMNNLPAVLPLLLYKHQAQHLVRELGKVKVVAHPFCVED